MRAMINYFAYGSNMSPLRLQARVGSVELIGAGMLEHYALAFRKKGKDGSGKCDISAGAGNRVFGGLFEISKEGLEVLDRIEGLGFGYERLSVSVVVGDRAMQALTYRATHIDPTARPFTWYLRHVQEGATALALPDEYRARIQSVGAVRDADLARERRELAIYAQ